MAMVMRRAGEASLLLALLAPAGALGLSVSVTDAAGRPVPGLVLLVETEAGASGGPSRVVARGTTSETGSASLLVPQESRGVLRIESSKWWAAVYPLDGAADSETVRLQVEPAGILTGALSNPRGAAPPGQVLAKFQFAGPRAETGARGQTEVRCDLEAATFRCVLPARVLDLELRVPGFASHFFWEKRIEVDRGISVGSLTLRPGGSVVGWVATESGVPDPKACEIRLASVSDTRKTSARQEEMNRFRGASTRPDSRGFFTIEGLTPGDYRLEVEQVGFGSETAYPVPVVGTGQTRLPNPIVLRRPFEAEILISPELDPSGQPWFVSLARATVPAGSVSPSVAGQADFVGRFVAKGLAPGTYLVKVEASSGAAFYGRDVELDPSSPVLPIDLEFARVRGRLLVDDRPTRGTLDFGGKHRVPRVRAEADESGQFEAVLPRWGDWRVDVEIASLEIETEEQVEIAKPLRKPFAEVEISIQDGRVRGLVETRDGEPVAGARVRVDAAKTIWRTTDESGRFEVRGLPSRPVQLKAFTREARSRPRTVEVGTSRESEEVTLVLEPTDLFGGIVTSELGPVPGASVTAWVAGLSGLEPMEAAASDAQGHFELQMTRGGTAVELVVFSPGFALFAGRFDLDGPMPAVILLENDSGDVEVSGGWNDSRLRSSGIRPYLFFDGVPVPLGLLARWTELNGRNPYSSQDTLRIPRLPPGPYRLCGLPLTQLLLHGPLAASSGVECSSGTLGLGGILALGLKAETPTESR